MPKKPYVRMFTYKKLGDSSWTVYDSDSGGELGVVERVVVQHRTGYRPTTITGSQVRKFTDTREDAAFQLLWAARSRDRAYMESLTRLRQWEQWEHFRQLDDPRYDVPNHIVVHLGGPGEPFVEGVLPPFPGLGPGLTSKDIAMWNADDTMRLTGGS